MSLGIVIPLFRPDVAVLSAYVRSIDETISPEHIRIESDAPTTDTRQRLRQLADEVSSVSVSASPERRGKGAAITAGFEALETDTLAFLDADGATPIGSVEAIIDPVRRGETPIAVGSRRHPHANVASHQGHLRRLLGDGFAWLARRTVGRYGARLYDYQCGAKAFTAAVWRAVRTHIRQSGFAWDLEFVAVAGALGYDVREVPIRWEDKPGSTVAPVRDTASMFVGLLAARHRAGVAAGSVVHRSLDFRSAPPLIERVGPVDSNRPRGGRG